MPKRYLDPAAVSADLVILGRHYHAGTVRLMGGEPLLHPDLVGLMNAIKKTGISDTITIVTNGVLLPRMSEEFWNVVDHVEVSLYPGKEISDEEQARCRALAAEHGGTIDIEPDATFRESHSETGTTDERLRRSIYRSCRVAHWWRCHTLADGRFYKCPQSYYLPQVLESCDGNHLADSIAIEDSDHFRVELRAYLDAPEPLLTCGTCLGTAGKRFPHEQVGRRDFRSHQQRPAEELIDYALLRPVPLLSRARRRLGEAYRARAAAR
jgi:hypothetical protein